jgi:hypothetical protein
LENTTHNSAIAPGNLFFNKYAIPPKFSGSGGGISSENENLGLFGVRAKTENSISSEQAFVHMIKAMLGTGLLSLPLAFKHSGLYVSF